MRFITQAAKVLNEQKKSKRRLAVFMCLAAVVALGTVAALKMYGQAMSHKEKRLVCTVEAHRHTDACYDADGNLVCGQADYLVHTHNDDCYGADGELVCHLPEIAAHTHTDACYTEEDVLVCTEQEQAHQHTDACYTPQRGELTCQLEEHTHGDDCYDSETGELTCQLEEHQHGDACYAWEEVLTCPYAAGGHQHSSDCYTKERGELTCPLEEHTHGDDCYDENGELTCQIEEHTHDDNCYAWEDVLTCQMEETPAGHTHTDACYEKKKILTCGQLELHTHTEDCYDENGALACGLLELKEHTHQEECFETVELTDEEVAQKLEQEKMEESFQGEDPGNAPEDGNANAPDNNTGTVSGDSVSSDETGSVSGDSVSGDSISADRVSGNSVSGDETDSVSENDADVHEHDETCYDAAGGLMCGYEDVEDPAITQTYEDEDGQYIITASYHHDASIPDGAKLKAEMITAESDGESYAKHEAEMRKRLGDENAEMDALFKIGFYTEDGEEVEPEGDVMVTVQFLFENGLADGDPMTIIHFTEDGSEVIGASHVKDKSTSFKTNKFSIFAFFGMSRTQTDESEEQTKEIENELEKPQTIRVHETDTYKSPDGTYEIDFEINGKAALPAGVTTSSNESKKDTVVSDDAGEASKAPLEGQETNEGTEEEGEDGTTERAATTDDSGTDAEEDAALPDEEGTVEGATSDNEDAPENSETGNTDLVEDESVSEEDAGEEADAPSDDAADETQPSESQATAGENKLKFQVEYLDESMMPEEYTAVKSYVESINKGEEELLLDVLSYSLTYEGTELDVTGCEITAKVRPTGKLLEQAAKKTEVSETDAEATFTFMGVTGETQVDKIDEINVDADTIANAEKSYTLASEKYNFFAARATGQPNPKFTVQYYANLDILATTGGNELPVIDTSGKKLPTNGKGTSASPNGNAIKNIRVDSDGNIMTENTPTEVYKSRPFEYHKAPTINYMNALIKNPNYKLKEVWVLKSGKTATSIAKGDWDIYGYSENLHFTNRSVSGTAKPGGNSGYVLIKDGATLRFLYDVTDAKPDIKAAFYDYDITSGRLYTNVTNAINNSNNGITQTGSQKNDTLYYTYTKQAGINSEGNYSGSGTKLAFGNVNTGTSMGENLWGGNLLNKYNGTQGGHPTVTGSYKGCTFGLVTGLKDKKIQYASGVLAPKLFNEGETTGKTTYAYDEQTGNYGLKFIRKGDTYTLTAVNGTTASGLESFGHPSPYKGKVHDIWTNDFWPMDSVPSYGTNGHDLKFGSYEYRNNRAYAGNPGTSQGEPGSTATSKRTYPYSDDGKDHNSYFGMNYAVEFELSDDYVGPLEYYFFGDDDMWVFLDDQLVCDIGGVHSSVGEYVNLWDYLKKGSKGKHTLSFFYTERGASGSTCWMQFTLPSVSTLTPETTDEDYGHLRIEKTVTQIQNGNSTIVDNNDEFSFTINFTNKKGEKLPDDYSYVKYDKDGKEIGSDLIIWDGGEFTLKNGEYIIVQYLPEGAKYKITETNGAITITDNTSVSSNVEYFTDVTVDGTLADDKQDLDNNKTAEGNILSSNTAEVKYNNKFYVYILPKTGGPGIYMVYAAVALLASSAALLKYRQIRRRREGIGR